MREKMKCTCLLFLLTIFGHQTYAQDCSGGCFYSDSYADVTYQLVFGSTALETDLSEYAPLFFLHDVLSSPSGRISESFANCTANSTIDTNLPVLNNQAGGVDEEGDYTLTPYADMYYQTPGYSGCQGTPAILTPRILRGNLKIGRTYFQDPIPTTILGSPVPGLYDYRSTACLPGTSTSCSNGVGVSVMSPPPYYAYARYFLYKVTLAGFPFYGSEQECEELRYSFERCGRASSRGY